MKYTLTITLTDQNAKQIKNEKTKTTKSYSEIINTIIQQHYNIDTNHPNLKKE